MKVTLERAVLVRALTHVQSVVERRNTIPILSNVLLEAEDDRLTLTATDMDLTVIESVAADIALPGAITVPAHMLYDIARKLNDGAQIQLEQLGDGRMQLTSGRAEFSLSTLPREDFPRVTVEDLPTTFALQAAQLRELIDRTKFAMSTEETRYYLNGLYLHINEISGDQHLCAAATDGHRLAAYNMPAPMRAEGMAGVIVPRKTILESRKLLDDTDDNIEISLSETKISFAVGGVRIISKLVDGTFPDYQRVIPQNNDNIVHVEARSLSAAVDRVSTITLEKTRAVKVSVRPGLVHVVANSPDAGSGSDEIEANYDGEEITIAFNARYLIDVLNLMDDGVAEMALADSAAPALIRISGVDNARYVLMPMRV